MRAKRVKQNMTLSAAQAAQKSWIEAAIDAHMLSAAQAAQKSIAGQKIRT